MGVSSKTAAVAKMHGHGVMIDALLGGTEAMRAAGKSYLPQWPQEEDDGYQTRLGTSTLLPVLKETIGQMVGRVFFRDIGTDKVSDGLKDYLQNFDLQNNALNVFCAAWFADALAKGASYVLVDYPDGKARTKAEEKALGLRPYAVFVRNSDVLGFRYEMRQGRPVCTQFRYRQAVTEYDGDFGERTVEQINVHEAGRVRRYRMDKDGNWLLHSEADQSRNGEPLGFVPVVDLVLEKTGFFAGRPPLMELAYLNVKHWQSQSDQDNIVHYVRVPLLQYRGSEDVQNVVAAAGNMISVGADGELNYVEHSGAAISAGVTAIEKLETDMQAAGAKLLTRTKLALTESQARDEAGREISLLRHYANLLEDAIGRVLDMMAAWHGLDDGGAVEISGSIDDNGNPESSVDVLVRMNAAGVLSNETLFEEAKRRGLLSDYLKWEDEAARLDSQSAAGLDFSGKRDEERPSE